MLEEPLYKIDKFLMLLFCFLDYHLNAEYGHQNQWTG